MLTSSLLLLLLLPSRPRAGGLVLLALLSAAHKGQALLLHLSHTNRADARLQLLADETTCAT